VTEGSGYFLTSAKDRALQRASGDRKVTLSCGVNSMPLNPPHPGDFLRTEIIEAAGLSVTAASEILGVSRPALSSLFNSKSDLSGEKALRVEKFGVKMDRLMRMQSSFDIARTRKRERNIRARRFQPQVDLVP
jgi:addiction module HigA family antidote